MTTNGTIQVPAFANKDSPVICVFCGSSPGTSSAHLAAARALAQSFHAHGVNLVYGGGTIGLMGEVARTLVALSGPDAVRGVIPGALVKYEQANGEPSGGRTEIDESRFGRTTVVPDMHQRKKLMADLVERGGAGSGFVALSGGYGTLEEIMEITTWSQLSIHDRGVCLFNVEGYWDGLLQWVKKAVDSGFVSEGNKDIMVEAKTADEVVQQLREYRVAESRFNLQWGQQ